MKTLFNITSAILIFLGIGMMAGSGGDCDGKCMEYANSLGETIMYASIGLVMMITGGLIAIKQNN